MHEAENIIAQLGLQPLPDEGGWFRQTWVSAARLAGGRAATSQIWYLLTAEGFSALHRVDAEEAWIFLAGDPVGHVQLVAADGTVRRTELARPADGPVIVPAGVWQGARLAAGAGSRGWALLGCTMSPAWDRNGFALGRRGDLARQFPGAADLVRAMTR
jgi:predicted cupin superfamily sugar epimerase